MSYRVTEGRRLQGAMFGMRETVPIGGCAGGEPGAPSSFVLHRADGTREVLQQHGGLWFNDESFVVSRKRG